MKAFLPKRSLLSFVFFSLIYIFSSCHMKSLHALKKICIFTLTSDPHAFLYTCTRACTCAILSGLLEYNDQNSWKKSFDRFSFCDGNLCIFPARSYMEYSFLLFWHCSWTTRCRKPRAAHTITRTENESHDNLYFTNSLQIISYNQEILYATLRSSYHYLLRSW